MRDFDVSIDVSDGLDALTGAGKTFSIVTTEQRDGYVASIVGGRVVKEVYEDGSVLRFDSEGNLHGSIVWFDGSKVEYKHGVPVDTSYWVDSVDKFGDLR